MGHFFGAPCSSLIISWATIFGRDFCSAESGAQTRIKVHHFAISIISIIQGWIKSHLPGVFTPDSFLLLLDSFRNVFFCTPVSFRIPHIGRSRQLHLLHWSSWLTHSSISQFSCLTVLPPTKAEIFLLGVLSTICVWDYVVVGWKFELNILVVGPVNRISGTSVLSRASLDGFSVLFWTSIHPCHHHHQYQGKRILK